MEAPQSAPQPAPQPARQLGVKNYLPNLAFRVYCATPTSDLGAKAKQSSNYSESAQCASSVFALHHFQA